MLAFLIIAVALAIGIGIGMKQYNINKQLISDGRMIQRHPSFVETAEIFTLHNADFKKVLNAVTEDRQSMNGTGVSVKFSEEARLIVFTSSLGWEASLSASGNEGDTYSYTFNFTSWNTRNGVAQNTTSMNVALTAIEKLFIRLDPNTKVSTERIKTKSKTKFF